ncbi:MAG: DUF3488 domain-containing protein [Rhodobiaceae bacterium]|nr:DUF3488 domain-containing protein [Rhodobiaceae bacterium]
MPLPAHNNPQPHPLLAAMERFLPGTPEAQLTGLLLYLAAFPIAISLTVMTDWRAFLLYTAMWPVALMARNRWRMGLICLLAPLVMFVLAQWVRPPQAGFFMLLVLVLSACEQVQADGRPGAFNIIGVIFPALCVMVLSANVFMFLLLLVSVIFYIGVFTLRINGMPLSGLRIRLLPILLALSGSLFFAIAAFILMPRINASALPGFQQEDASSGVGEELDMGRFSNVILNGEDAFRAFVPKPLPSQDLYWRVHVLTTMKGARWLRDPSANLARGLPDFMAKLGDVSRPVAYHVRHAEAAPKWHPVLGVPTRGAIDRDAMLNPQGEFVPIKPSSVLSQQVKMRAALDNPYSARQIGETRIDGQQKLAAWARQTYRQLGSREAFVGHLLQRFRTGGYGYTLSPPRLEGADSEKLDDFFFATKMGYCSHYAMAMATALRAAGIPANVIIGYAGGEWNGFGGYYRVRQSDAHAWVEAEMAPGQWQRFDPTQFVPDARLQFRSRQMAASRIGEQEGWRGSLARGAQRIDAFVTRLNSDIVLYDEAARQELLSGSFLGRLISFVTFWLVASAILLVPLALWRWWGRRDPLLRLDQAFFKLGAKQGVERQVHEGRLAYAARWKHAHPDMPKPRSASIEQCAILLCEMMFKLGPNGKTLEAQAATRRQIGQHLQIIQRQKFKS